MRQSNRPERGEQPAAVTAAGLRPEEWIDRLLELETAKKKALMTFDADLYEVSSREQSRLVDSGTPDLGSLPRGRARAFALAARLNSALLLNLFSISPQFALVSQAYGPSGAPSNARSAAENLQVEA